MEVFMRNISYEASDFDVIRAIANRLHQPPLNQYGSGMPVNFDVSLHPQKSSKSSRANHRGRGSLTLPSEQLGHHFLRIFGPGTLGIEVNNRPIRFSISKYPVSQSIVDNIKDTPYQDPAALESKHHREQLLSTTVHLDSLQFGWRCRDGMFSCEWEAATSDGWLWILAFSDDRRVLEITSPSDVDIPSQHHRSDVSYLSPAFDALFGDWLHTFTVTELLSIVIRFNNIDTIEADVSEKRCLLAVRDPMEFYKERKSHFPEFEGTSKPRSLERLSYVSDDHKHIAPYTGTVLGVLFSTGDDMEEFLRMCDVARLRQISETELSIERRGLFSPANLEDLDEWFSTLPWKISFQLEAVIHNGLADPAEVLELRDRVTLLVRAHGASCTERILVDFKDRLDVCRAETAEEAESPLTCLEDAVSSYETDDASTSKQHANLIHCRHIKVTPTGYVLEGPLPERSNTVFRSYENPDNFVRVSFVDENMLQYRWEPGVDGAGFINKRVKQLLHNGLRLGGRNLEFLAYSQSALKEHSVWYMIPFRDVSSGLWINSEVVRRGLGDFRKLARLPAKLGARWAQCFTATHASTVVTPESVLDIEDIERDGCLTDGCGTISVVLRNDICSSLIAAGLLDPVARLPSAFQIRMGGVKGMISVDYTLPDSLLCVRPSMTKFSSDDFAIAIARVIDHPSALFLNRPLVVLLEGLGVPQDVFMDLQKKAVLAIKSSAHQVEGLAELLNQRGLGESVRMSSTLKGLHRMGISHQALSEDSLFKDAVAAAINHSLRGIKYHARIPIPESWLLVGIVDVHDVLQEDEIYACVKPAGSNEVLYLEGRVLITRSPVIHPGDVQFATAIGKPSAPSPFDHDDLSNTLVFSCRGRRSLASCLGGGDLDGDEFGIITLPALHPPQAAEPAAYPPVAPYQLDHDCTKEDVGDFVAEYINSDVVGMIASTHLILSDQREDGIFDKDCLVLAALHSNAVDYPKSGVKVNLSSIPRPRGKMAKPDFLAPETREGNLGSDYYQSKRALGHMFRAIDLDDVNIDASTLRSSRRKGKRGKKGRLQQDNIPQDLQEGQWGNIDGALRPLVQQAIGVTALSDELKGEIAEVCGEFESALLRICKSCSLTRRGVLTEAEVLVGTIMARTSRLPERRKAIHRLHEYTKYVVEKVRDSLCGRKEERDVQERLQRAWAGWLESLEGGTSFGARSFGWIAVSCIFDCLKEMESA